MKSLQTQQMEEKVLAYQSRIQGLQEDRINRMVSYRMAGCSHEEQWLTLAFPVEEWMLNPVGVLHGGIICTMFDISCGTMSIYLAGGFTPTVQLAVNFLRSVKIGDTLEITARCTHPGRTINNIAAEARSVKTGKICASATGMFFSAGSDQNPMLPGK